MQAQETHFATEASDIKTKKDVKFSFYRMKKIPKLKSHKNITNRGHHSLMRIKQDPIKHDQVLYQSGINQ